MTDAAHLLSDFVGLLVSLSAVWLGQRPPTKTLSFGFHRAGLFEDFLPSSKLSQVRLIFISLCFPLLKIFVIIFQICVFYSSSYFFQRSLELSLAYSSSGF